MPHYRFRLLDPFGHLVVGHFVHLADDSQARAHADKLLSQSDHSSVEVLDKERSVYRADERRSPRPG